jgi:hypothetical protein
MAEGHMYLRATGNLQGVLRGPIARQKQGSNWFEVFSLSFPDSDRKRISPPTSDPKKKTPGSIGVVLVPGNMLAFIKAYRSGELLSVVEFQRVKLNPDGTERIDFPLRLLNVLIDSFDMKWDPDAGINIEMINLSYEDRDWTYLTPDPGQTAPQWIGGRDLNVLTGVK